MSVVSELRVKDFGGVIEVVITPPESGVFTLGGKNAQGKSSILNALLVLLLGPKAAPKRPVREGADKAVLSCRISRPEGDIIVERTFTEAGRPTITVKAADGAKYDKPQALLDSLLGAISFDPSEFLRLDEKKQVEQLRGRVGIDFAALDAEYSDKFHERTAVNRDVKQQQAVVDRSPFHPGMPSTEVSVAALVAELRKRTAINEENRRRKEALLADESKLESRRVNCESIRRQIAELERTLKIHETHLAAMESEITRQREAVDELVDVDIDGLQQEIDEADETNAKIRANLARERSIHDLDESKAASEALTKRLDEITAEKARMLEEAAWPVPGLGFDDDGVTFDGRPLSQASTAEATRVGLAIGMALNPKLKVLILRHGSLMDDDTMAVVAESAEANGFLVLVEKVSSDGKGCNVVISEGRVAEPAAV